MKNVMMMALMALMTLAAQAADDKVNLTSGNGEWLKESDKTTSVVIDYSNTIAEGQPLNEYLKSRGEKNVADWPEVAKVAREQFIELFNKRNKKGVQAVDADKADMQIKVIVDKLHFGNTAMQVLFGGLGSAGGAEISGKMIVTDNDGKTLAAYDLIEVRGRAVTDYTEGRRLGSVFEQIIKMVIKASK